MADTPGQEIGHLSLKGAGPGKEEKGFKARDLGITPAGPGAKGGARRPKRRGDLYFIVSRSLSSRQQQQQKSQKREKDAVLLR